MDEEEIKEELAKGLEELSENLDRTPNSYDIMESDLFSTYTISKYFGSINEAIEYCGLEKNAVWGESDEYYIQAVEKLANEIDSSPTANEIREKSEVSVTEIQRRWGSLNEFKRELGMDTCPSQTTKEEFYREEGYWLTGEENPMYGRTGSKNPSFNPDKPEVIKKENELRRWSRRVKERDNYECKDCGSEDEVVFFAHHIERKSESPEKALGLDNGVTLCANCHAERHIDDEGKYRSLKALAERIEEEGNIYK